MRNLFVMVLLAIFSLLPLLFAIGPAIETIFAESLVPSSESTLHNLTVNQLSILRSDPIPISNSMASNNNCSTGWYMGGYFLPTYTQAICHPDSIITTTNISIGDPAYDQFDSYIINATNHYGITDSMMVKSMILQESSFDMFAISQDIPCGIPDLWTDQESRSFGLMQVTPACIEDHGSRPDLTTDMNSPNWNTSWFNPEYNINRGVKSLSDNLLLMESEFPGCSNAQYMLMALGAYNSGEGAIYGCGEWNDRADEYITNVTTHHRILSQMSNILNAD